MNYLLKNINRILWAKFKFICSMENKTINDKLLELVEEAVKRGVKK